MEPKQFNVFVESSAVEDRRNGIAPMGYGFLILDGGIDPVAHWGFGAEKDTQAMLAHGLQDAADEIFLECEEPVITVIKRNVGVQKFLTDFVPIWRKKIAEGALGFSRHNQQVWERLYKLHLLSKLTMRRPKNIEETRLVRQIESVAYDSGKKSREHRLVNRAMHLSLGVFVTDADRSFDHDSA